VFTEALGEEVEVALVQAIGRGDEVCEFEVYGS
jgi:predicted hydrocarbon binding protein